jgi:hypothetical protein
MIAGSCSGATSDGAIAVRAGLSIALKAADTPVSTKIHSSEGSAAVNEIAARAPDATMRPICTHAVRRLRSTESASAPPAIENRISGTTSTSPSRPTATVEPVIRKTW